MLDLAMAGALVVLLAPVLAALALLVRIFMGRPVLFRQVRPGQLGRPFELVKFRTLLERYDEEGRRLPHELRVTHFGQVLRKTSLDELPELINVLRGDMSMVGPRPLLMEYLPLYDAEQAKRQLVRPGLTGLAQVGGRNALSWEQKFALDVAYVEQRNLRLDLRIMVQTIPVVLRCSGIAPMGEATSPPFVGSARVGAEARR
jgi:sugar transferase EpsL